MAVYKVCVNILILCSQLKAYFLWLHETDSAPDKER